ncbi:MAG: acyltransferase family protein [Rhodopila sp.]
MPPAIPQTRIPGLDGLRGIAALSVALGHCLLQVTGLPLWGTSLRDFPSMQAADIAMRVFSTLLPSDAAVMVFFVLSGHVLWQSFQRRQARFLAGLPDYASARIYRLMPLVIVTGLPIGLLSNASAPELVRNMLLLSTSLNNVLWSLQVEMVASLTLFALWGLTRGAAWMLLLALVFAFGITPFFRGQGAVVFFPAFVLGALVSSIPPRLWQNSWLLAGSTAMLLFSNLFLGHGGVTRCFEMLGATALIAAVAHGRLSWLGTSLPLFLGAISYPFYLTHVLGLWAAEPYLAMLPPVPDLVMIAARAVLSIALTIPLAWALHVFVEDPVLRARPRLDWWPRTRQKLLSADGGSARWNTIGLPGRVRQSRAGDIAPGP